MNGAMCSLHLTSGLYQGSWGTALIKMLWQTLPHPCSSLCTAASREKHISIPVHITEQQQNRGTQQSLMPAELTATGSPLSHGKRKPGIPHFWKVSEKMQGPGEINYHNDGERQPWNNTLSLCHSNTNQGGSLPNIF